MRYDDQFAGILNNTMIEFVHSKQKQNQCSARPLTTVVLVVFLMNMVIITCLLILPGGFLLRDFHPTATYIRSTSDLDSLILH